MIALLDLVGPGDEKPAAVMPTCQKSSNGDVCGQEYSCLKSQKPNLKGLRPRSKEQGCQKLLDGIFVFKFTRFSSKDDSRAELCEDVPSQKWV